MSDPHPPPAAGAPAKKGPGAKVWAIVGTVIVVLVGLIVLFTSTRSLLPEVFSGFNGTLSVGSQGFSEGSVLLSMLGISFGTWMTGWFSLFIRAALYVLMFAVAAFLIGNLLKKLK